MRTETDLGVTPGTGPMPAPLERLRSLMQAWHDDEDGDSDEYASGAYDLIEEHFASHLTIEGRALALVANYLTPGNQNVVNGDLLASLRDLLQIHVSTKGLLAELELARDVQVTNVERRQFESGDKLGAIRAWRVRTQKGLQDARTAFGQAGLGWVRS